MGRDTVLKKSSWRWLLVIPAAVGGYVGIQICAQLIMWMLLQGNPEDSFITTEDGKSGFWNLLLETLGIGTYLAAAIKQIVGPVGFVIAGVATAPSRQTGTKVVLAILMIILLSWDSLTIWGWARGLGWTGERQVYGYMDGTAQLWWILAMTIVGIGILVYFCASAINETKE